MIVWIASYPKSGNTWIRSLLTTYLFSKDNNFHFNSLKEIQQFPDKQYFDFFLNDLRDIKKVSNYWIAAQERINLLKNDGLTFLKTHSALCTLEGNPFTNKNNTTAVIYIVRDPRNLITSFAHHYSMNIEEAYNFITNKNQTISHAKWGEENFGISSVLGNWSEHYKSWSNITFAPILIIKYEDLINDTENEFKKILNFLNKFRKTKIDKQKITNSVKNCSFEKLAEMEKKEGFFESAISKKNLKKLNFFYLGKKNNWKKLLNPKIEQKIRKSFQKEMEELGYI